MAYQAVDEIMARCEKDGVEFWKAVQLEDCEENGISEEESWNQMTHMWNSMKESVAAYDPEAISRSGLVGREGKLMDAYREQEKPLCGDFVSKVIANALKMGCNNACMKRIVAAPTAGACGVMPAVLVTYYKEYEASEKTMIQALYVAAGIGQVIASRASLAGPPAVVRHESRFCYGEWQQRQSVVYAAEVKSRWDMHAPWHLRI